MYDDEFAETELPAKRVDRAAIKILKEYVAKHDGDQHDGGVVIDREFVVVEPDYSHR